MYAAGTSQAATRRRRWSMPQLVALKGRTPIVMVTAYDASMARLVDEFADAILVGDSLGMVVQGHESTIPVTLDEMVYHTRLVTRTARHALVIGDLPFMSYQASVPDAVRAAGRVLKEGGAQAVKLEGGLPVVPQVRAIVDCGIPVVAHVGVTPQSVHALGGYGKQGKSEAGAQAMLEAARALDEAGASLLVLENIPHDLAGEITGAIRGCTIGIGAGPHCDGQVQVFHDLMGLDPDFTPRHAKRFFEGGRGIRTAMEAYAQEVRAGTFVSE